MNQLSRESRALLNAARHGDSTSEADRTRIRGNLTRRLAAGLAVGTAVTATATAAKAAHAGTWATVAAWLPGAAKVVGIAAVAGAVSVGVVQVASTSGGSGNEPAPGASSSVQSKVKQSTPQSLHAAVPADPVEPESIIEVNDPPRSPTSTVQQLAASHDKQASRSVAAPIGVADTPVNSDAPSVPNDNLGNEVSAIREARAAIRRGDAQAALDAIDRQFPEGQSGPLAPEATMARVSALCSLGNVAAARRVADQFLARFPDSPLAARMRGSCAYVSVTEP